MFARSDRSRWPRSIGADERQAIGRGQRLASARRPGAVRTDEHEPHPDEGAVARRERTRSDLANKTIQALFRAEDDQIEPPGQAISPEEYRSTLLNRQNDTPLDGLEELIVALHDIGEVLPRLRRSGVTPFCVSCA